MSRFLDIYKYNESHLHFSQICLIDCEVIYTILKNIIKDGSQVGRNQVKLHSGKFKYIFVLCVNSNKENKYPLDVQYHTIHVQYLQNIQCPIWQCLHIHSRYPHIIPMDWLIPHFPSWHHCTSMVGGNWEVGKPRTTSRSLPCLPTNGRTGNKHELHLNSQPPHRF